MAKQTILLIEDEQSIAELVKYNLEQEGCVALHADNGAQGVELAIEESPDLVLLDLMLPGMSGLDVCKTLRQNPKTKNIPIIMLTAKSEEIDKVIGLELGADDYVTKPFSPRELVARIKAVIRRSSQENIPSSDDVLRVGELELDVGKHRIKVSGQKVELTSKEFSLLKTLIEAGGRVLSRDYLLDKVWGYDKSLNIETRTVDMHIGQLRKKIKGEAKRVVTVKNAGYRFENESS